MRPTYSLRTFFLHSHRHHLDLHSFPTRRSSDLVAIKVLPAHLSSDPARRQRFEREAKAISALNHPHICTLYDRSEEHTSELQSRGHLVCRLLLEKKKPIHNSTYSANDRAMIRIR